MCVNNQYVKTGKYDLDIRVHWDRIPFRYNEVVRSVNGTLWAIGALGRMKLTMGRSTVSSLPIGYETRHPLPKGAYMETLAYRPSTKEKDINKYVILRSGCSPVFYSGTQEAAEKEALALGRRAELHLLTKVAEVQEVQTTELKVVRSNDADI